MENRHPKGFTIIINGRKKHVKRHEICFDRLVELAFGDVPCSGNTIFTVTYTNGPCSSPEGVLVEGECVHIQNGTVFNVARTDKS